MFSRIKLLKNNIVFRNGVLFTFFSFLNNGINFLLLIILANFLTPTDYGQLNLFNTLILLLSILITLNVESFFSVCFFKESFKDIRRLVNIIFLIAVSLLLVFLLIISLFSNSLHQLVGLSAENQFIALFVCFFQVFNNMNLETSRLEEKPLKYGFFSVGIVLLNLMLTFILIMGFHYGWLGRIYAQLFTAFSFFIISVYALIRKKYFVLVRPKKKLFYKSLLFGLPLIPHSISGWVRMGLDRYIINFVYGAAQVGVFSFAFNFSGVINVIGASFNAAHSVQIYKLLSNGGADSKLKLYQQTKIMIVVYSCFSGIIFLLSFFFIPIFLPQYNESRLYLFPLCIAGLFQCIYYLFVNYLFYFNKTKVLMFITFGVSILHLLLSLLLTRYSLLYTAYITMCTNALVCLLVYFYSTKVYPLKK